MKSSILLSLLCSFSAFAAPQPYHFNRTSTSDGYAMAFGSPGKSYDFDAVIQQGSDAAFTFLDAHASEWKSYLVDIQSGAILSDITEPLSGMPAAYNLGNVSYGNKFDIGLVSISPQTNNSLDMVFVIDEYYWSSEIAKVVVVDRSSGVSKVAFEQKDLQADLEKQIRYLLPGSVTSRLDKMATSISLTKGLNAEGTLFGLNYNYSGQIPKGDGEVEVHGFLTADIVNGKVVLKVHTAKVVPVKY